MTPSEPSYLIDEIWKVIPIAQKYEASNLGRIRRISTGKIVSQQKCSNGQEYLSVRISADDKWRTLRVHRLVLMAFERLPLPREECNHKDLNGANNRIDNLEWTTSRENTIHAFANRSINRHKGEKRNLSAEKIREISQKQAASHRGTPHFSKRIPEATQRKIKELRASKLSHQKIADLLGIHRRTVQRIIYGTAYVGHE